MGSDEQAASFLARYGLADLSRFSDPECHLYRAFGLRRLPVRKLLTLRVLRRGFAAVWRGHRQGLLIVGDGLRMPGVFLVRDGAVVRSYRHEGPGDLPDYLDLASCPLPPEDRG